MCQSAPIRVLIVDRYHAARHALMIFLQAYDDLELAGEAPNGAEAARLCSELGPDVVLMDLVEPGNVAAIQDICESCPSVAIIGLTELSHGSASLTRAARDAGASACLIKGVAGGVLADAIRATRHGGARTG